MIPSIQRWNLWYLLIFSVPLAVAILSSCVWIIQVLLLKEDLLAVVESGLYKMGIFLVFAGIVTVISMFFLVCIVFIPFTKLLICLVVFTCFVIVLEDHATRYPSVSEDEAFLHNVMIDYGIDDGVTKMLNTTQRELESCGVVGNFDWKQVMIDSLDNEFAGRCVANVPIASAITNEMESCGVLGYFDWKQVTIDSLDNEFAGRGVAYVPIACAITHETTAGFHVGGCRFSFKDFEMDAYESFFQILSLLLIFEGVVSLLIESILDGLKALDPDFNSRGIQDAEAAIFQTLIFPRLPGEELKFRGYSMTSIDLTYFSCDDLSDE